jgi:hypothetical protein
VYTLGFKFLIQEIRAIRQFLIALFATNLLKGHRQQFVFLVTYGSDENIR